MTILPSVMLVLFHLQFFIITNNAVLILPFKSQFLSHISFICHILLARNDHNVNQKHYVDLSHFSLSFWWVLLLYFETFVQCIQVHICYIFFYGLVFFIIMQCPFFISINVSTLTCIYFMLTTFCILVLFTLVGLEIKQCILKNIHIEIFLINMEMFIFLNFSLTQFSYIHHL